MGPKRPRYATGSILKKNTESTPGTAVQLLLVQERYKQLRIDQTRRLLFITLLHGTNVRAYSHDSFVKKRRRVLALFMTIFLRNRSLSDAWWFYGKNRKIGKGNLYLTENRLSWNEMCCASDNHNYMCHTCAKEFLNSSFNKAVINKISHFHNIAPNFTFFFTKIVIFQVYLQLFRPTASSL